MSITCPLNDNFERLQEELFIPCNGLLCTPFDPRGSHFPSVVNYFDVEFWRLLERK